MKKFISQIKSRITNKGEPSEDLDIEDGYVELEGGADPREKKIIVRRYALEEFEDIKEILNTLRKGDSICFINIKTLKDSDLPELKRAINKLKKTCEAVDGEIAGFGEDWICAVPSSAVIHKTKQQQAFLSEDDLE